VKDPEVLKWAATNDRILLTHDRTTMTKHAYERVERGEPVVGVFVFKDRVPVGEAVEEILLINECSEQVEWRDRVVFFPQ
jgi:hypothetical protein